MVHLFSYSIQRQRAQLKAGIRLLCCPAAAPIVHAAPGSNEVSVPTHLYKVVVVKDPSLPLPLLAAFVVPNSPLGDVPLTDFQVPLHTLERHTGQLLLVQLLRANLWVVRIIFSP